MCIILKKRSIDWGHKKKRTNYFVIFVLLSTFVTALI